MTQNNLFGICIPTYNRANELKKCILSFLDEAKKYNIPIYIHDNNSTDDTDKLIETFQKEYKYIFYKKNKENLGIDKNMLSVINMAETKYALWLGSDDTLSSNAITLILDKLKEQPDLCLLDRKNTVDVLKSSYDNPFDFYQDNGQIGNTGMHFSTLIVKVDDTKKAIQEDGNRYIGTLHAYAGVILDYLMTNYKKNNKLNIITIKDFIINIATQNKSWERESLEVYYLYIPRWFKLLKKEYKTNEKVKNEYIRYLKRFKLPGLIKKSETLTGGGVQLFYIHNKVKNTIKSRVKKMNKNKFYIKKQLNILGIKIKYKELDPFVSFFQNVLCLNKDYADKEISKFKLRRKPIIKNMVLSMTSYPERMKDVHYAIFSILNQTIRPERFILWLAQEEFPNGEKDIPETVLQFKKFGLEIRFTDAIRSFKKIIPALKEFPDKILVSADDDIFYQKTWLENMYKSYKKDSSKIYAQRIHKVVIKDNTVQAYHNWIKCMAKPEASYLNFPTSVAGILYPPNSFTKEAINYDSFKKLCPNQDDVWVWAMAILNKRKFVNPILPINNNLVYINPERELGINDETTLAKINVLKGENDKQIKNVISYYNLIEVLINEK